MIKNIFSGVLINLLLLSSLCLATEDFYVFDVGQGNCNFAVYKESKIGFIFDAGSKNSKTISKISQFQTEEDEFAVFAEKKKQEVSLQKDIDYFSFFNEVVQNETTPKKPIIGKDMSFQTSAKKDTRIYSVREKIKGKIKEYKLERLFIFLSHPDEDHINLIAKKYKPKKSMEEITESIIPESITSIEALLGGDWVNHDTKDTQTVIEFLKTKKANINFPYYWRYEGSIFAENEFKYEPESNKYIQLKGIILNDINNAKKFLSPKYAPMYTSTKIVNTFFKYSPTMLDIGKVLYNMDSSELDSAYRRDLGNVYFRSFGAETDDVNSQSLIVSFRLPSLKTIITCTGDAESVTFSNIKEISSYVSSQENYLNAVVVPHHGALKNFSGSIITSLKPDLFFVSTGLTSYDHPNATALLAYEKSINTTSNFSKKYMRTENTLLNMSIVRTGKTDKDYGFIPFNQVPVLSTNLLGNISWRDSSINVSYSSILEQENNRYLVDTSHSVQSSLENLQQKKELTEEENQQILNFLEIINHFKEQTLEKENFPLILTTEINSFNYAVVQKSNKEYKLYSVKKI